jgi:histidinol dehydrogenase
MNIHLHPSRSEWRRLQQRPVQDLPIISELVDRIFSDVKSRGDDALLEYTLKYDGVKPDPIRVGPEAYLQAVEQIPRDLKDAIGLAASNIRRFHEAQKGPPARSETMEGVKCWQEYRPIERVGLYVPGGTAPLFSTLLMLAIPAQVAGCLDIQVCTPPDQDGRIHPAILYACHYLGIDKVFKVGGIQAIAAFTHGTETISPVYKIFGPGNQYVTAAKIRASMAGIPMDMPAGPSEVLVFSDVSGQADLIASDLLSQAEHGPDSQVLFVTTHESLIDRTVTEVEKQMQDLPRKAIISEALQHARLILLEDEETAFDFINQYAPEHLILNIDRAGEKVSQVMNAGSVFVGPFTPESAGDYASGTNHTLPTYGYARAFSGLTLHSFMKSVSFQEITREGLQKLAPAIIPMAEAEQLQGHKRAVTIRLNTPS